jgi:hypothetical protein
MLVHQAFGLAIVSSLLQKTAVYLIKKEEIRINNPGAGGILPFIGRLFNPNLGNELLNA